MTRTKGYQLRGFANVQNQILRVPPATLVVLVGMLFFPVTQALGGAPQGGLCPPGLIEEPNAGFSLNDVGCSLCLPEGCAAECIGIPVEVCPPGPSSQNTACCNANPCNGNCPKTDNPLCSFKQCACPDQCCTLACPGRSRAPVASPYGLVALSFGLVAVGVLYGRRRLKGTRPTS